MLSYLIGGNDAAPLKTDARLVDLLLRNAKALHIRNVGAEGLSNGVRQLSAQKADLLKIVSLLDDCRKDLHI